MKALFLLLSLPWNLNNSNSDSGLGSSLLDLQQKATNVLSGLSRDEQSDISQDVSFYLWTRANPVEPATIRLDDTLKFSLNNSNFNPRKPVKILVHGYTDNGLTGWIIDAKDAFLEKGDFNIISVEWEQLAGPAPFYFIAVRNTKLVSGVLKTFINTLKSDYKMSINSFHLIGFSLGAQLVGIAGYQLNGSLPRVTGLDPAAPMFHNVSDGERLSRHSARFVDVIHTAGLWIGVDEPVGNLDFYPNGGFAPQPGCDEENLGLSCSHARANKFFIESITSRNGFKAQSCDSWRNFQEGMCKDNRVIRMGMPASPRDPEGAYYLETKDKAPFAL